MAIGSLREVASWRGSHRSDRARTAALDQSDRKNATTAARSAAGIVRNASRAA
jgi:hypothetical protein